MKEVTVQIDPALGELQRHQLADLVKREVDEFSNFMATLGDWKSSGPLSNQERKLVESYLWQKLNGRIP
jgi:hypothetical protein